MICTHCWILHRKTEERCSAPDLFSENGRYERRLSQLLHDDLHWPDVTHRVQLKLAVSVHRCLRNQAPRRLTDCCVPVSEVAINSQFHVSVAAPLVLVPSPLWVQQPGTRSQTFCAMQLLDRTGFDDLPSAIVYVLVQCAL